MKRKLLKAFICILLSLVILALLWFFFGNPVSYLRAVKTAQTYLAETYPDTDLRMERFNFDFIYGDYVAYITSPSSIDTHFYLHINKQGTKLRDTYESDVLQKSNTTIRLHQEYNALADPVFSDLSLSCVRFRFLSRLEFDCYQGGDEPPSYVIESSELVLDKTYDIRELGRQAGHLIVYVDSATVNVELAASMMLTVKECFDRAGVPFAAMSFTLEYPMSAEGQRPDGAVRVRHFLYEDIYEDGMAERVAQATNEY